MLHDVSPRTSFHNSITLAIQFNFSFECCIMVIIASNLISHKITAYRK
jgi:hypothetical protein